MSVERNIVWRWVFLAFGVPAVLAAAPSQNGFLKQPLMAEATIASGGSAGSSSAGLEGYTPAPMPDLDRDAPVAQAVDPHAPKVSPKLFHKRSTYAGEGYVFGSTGQEEAYRKVGPAPGIGLSMPLQ